MAMHTTVGTVAGMAGTMAAPPTALRVCCLPAPCPRCLQSRARAGCAVRYLGMSTLCGVTTLGLYSANDPNAVLAFDLSAITIFAPPAPTRLPLTGAASR